MPWHRHAIDNDLSIAATNARSVSGGPYAWRA